MEAAKSPPRIVRAEVPNDTGTPMARALKMILFTRKKISSPTPPARERGTTRESERRPADGPARPDDVDRHAEDARNEAMVSSQRVGVNIGSERGEARGWASARRSMPGRGRSTANRRKAATSPPVARGSVVTSYAIRRCSATGADERRKRWCSGAGKASPTPGPGAKISSFVVAGVDWRAKRFPRGRHPSMWMTHALGQHPHLTRMTSPSPRDRRLSLMRRRW
jgi:hypothetical protein